MDGRDPVSEIRKYRKRATATVIAVQLDLETEGFTYQKWAGLQVCKRGDWLVDNGGDIYSVDRETFEQTYELVSPGVYAKTSPVWAMVADSAGEIGTKEGSTRYDAGDYLVFNTEDGRDGYAVAVEKFESMYEPVALSEATNSV